MLITTLVVVAIVAPVGLEIYLNQPKRKLLRIIRRLNRRRKWLIAEIGRCCVEYKKLEDELNRRSENMQADKLRQRIGELEKELTSVGWLLPAFIEDYRSHQAREEKRT